MFASLRVNWTILKTSVEERFVYRGDFALATLVRFLPIVTQIFLWGAIYAAGSANEYQTLNGYRYGDMVAYYLLAMVGRAFSSMPGLSSGIARDIRDGSIKKYLTQPVDMLSYLFWYRVAHKLVYYVIAAAPFGLVFYLCRDYFPGWPDAWTTAGFAASLIMAFFIGFLIESLLGLVAFWFLEVSSLLFIYMMLNYFLSGHMIPLDWLGGVGDAVQYLPFKYLAYTPAAIMLGRYPHDALARELAIEALWVLGLWGANRVTYERGVRRYGAFGG